MRAARSCLLAVLALSIAPAAMASNKGPTLRDRQQAACYGDVQKFCGAFMPDVDKVTACMEPRKMQVSAKCRELWDVK